MYKLLYTVNTINDLTKYILTPFTLVGQRWPAFFLVIGKFNPNQRRLSKPAKYDEFRRPELFFKFLVT